MPDADVTDTATTEDVDHSPENYAALAGEVNEDGDTFPRDYVEGLRRESAGYREKAKAAEARADELARALFTAQVAATGKVENPAEIPFDAAIVDDIDAINAIVDAAITTRPYIKARTFAPVGQGERGNHAGPQDFSTLFR